MAQPYIGEIRMFAGSFEPVGWFFCSGQLLPISEWDTLFNLIGTTYGGDGQETFALPNLQSRVPIHMGAGSFGTTYTIGETGGVEEVTLTTQQIPLHTHPLMGSTSLADDPNPGGKVMGESRPGSNSFFQDTPGVNMAPSAISIIGGSQPHHNIQPYLAINFIISMFGIYPSPS